MKYPENAPLVLTGASSGIGTAIAESLVAAGYPVIGLGRRREPLKQLSHRIGKNFDFHVLDLADDVALHQFAEETLANCHTLNGLIHCAGVLAPGSIGTVSAAALDQAMGINFRAPFLLTSILMGRLAAGDGHLVFVNSSAGLNASAGNAAYCASKFALRALADAARLEMNPLGIRVASIYPGRTATPLMENLYGREQRRYDPNLLLQPADVAAAVLAILSAPANAEITEVRLRPRRKSY